MHGNFKNNVLKPHSVLITMTERKHYINAVNEQT